MGLYLIKKEALSKTKSRIGESPILFNIPTIESIDIDTDEDFKFAEIVLAGVKLLKHG